MQSTSPALFLALWIVDDHAMRSAKPPQLLRFLLEQLGHLFKRHVRGTQR
ncbi:hypothetical protein USDA257_c55090 [Sinorhizobium fredii USDA 257]|uniref:Uncharacterized protein n=1 Tax=Sinorhizobium fredii (strain USDA 257) TaxID=1185652 RepID=I3XDR8_SINF2|nr:hypothetical protein USDA257_c55090 [Sinorhizobium fredii USDA 257]